MFFSEAPYVTLYHPEQLPETVFHGYKSNIESALSIGLSVAETGEERAIVFGLPGTGVGTFPYAVLWMLKERHNTPFSLIYLSCENMILESDIEESIEKLNMLIEEELMENEKEKTRTAFFIERPEVLSSEFKDFYGNKAVVSLWLSRFLRKRYTRTLMFCTSDDPSRIKQHLRNAFYLPIYLRYLDSQAITILLREVLSRKDYGKIAERLYNSTDKEGFKLVAAEVIKACKLVEEIEGFNEMSVTQATRLLRDHIFPCYPLEYLKNYESKNIDLILRSFEYSGQLVKSEKLVDFQ